jgi:alkylation response protein AidB-like acyl-CoA dehydrogenase
MTIDIAPAIRPGSQELAVLLARIAEDANERERTLSAPHEQIGWIREAGLGQLRLPLADGGAGASLPELFAVLIDLAAADSNVAHILRVHFAFVETQLHNPNAADRRRWIELLNAGVIFGNAASEQNRTALGFATDAPGVTAQLTPDGDHFRLNGVKYYSTGTLFADWTLVDALTPDGSLVSVAVALDRPGVHVDDDWDGFGQRLTGTGTTRLVDVEVTSEDVRTYGADPSYEGAFFQLFLQAVTAGILRAARDDTAALVRSRVRAFTHSTTQTPAEDPQVLQVVGEIAADAFAAEAIVLAAAGLLQQVSDSIVDGVADVAAVHRAQIAAANAKVAIDRFSYATAAHIFDAGGASATQSAKNLDRHWRNARTISTHNPTFSKATAVGAFHVNGTAPPQNGYF